MTKIDPSPKHGTSPHENESVSQPDGTAAQDPSGTSQSAKKQESGKKQQSSGTGPTGKNPGTSNNNARLRSSTPENREGALNPSAPTQSTEGPSTNLASLPNNPNSDAIGEIYHPDPKGNLDMGKMSNPPGTNTGHAINPGEAPRDNPGNANVGGNNPTSQQPGKEGAGDTTRGDREKDDQVA